MNLSFGQIRTSQNPRRNTGSHLLNYKGYGLDSRKGRVNTSIQFTFRFGSTP